MPAIQCERCGESFEAKRAAKYCPTCRPAVALGRGKAYYWRNPEKMRQRALNDYHADIEKSRANQRIHQRTRWRREHGLEGPGADRVVLTPEQRAAAKRADSRNRFAVVRKELLDAYGGACERCGFNDPRALQLDHVNGGGRLHRMATSRGIPQIREFIAERHSGKYQLLCANCHSIKTAETPVARPHKPDDDLYINRRRKR